MSFVKFRYLPAAAAIALFSSPSANATVVVNIMQSGADVVATTNGGINLAGLQYQGPFGGSPDAVVRSSPAILVVGGVAGVSQASLYVGGISGPLNFGSSSITNHFAQASSGDVLGITGAGFIYLPNAYVSASTLSGTSTWTSQTIASLDLIPGAYTYTFGSGANADSFVVNVGAVPEPTAISLMFVGLGFIGFMARKSRQASLRERLEVAI